MSEDTEAAVVYALRDFEAGRSAFLAGRAFAHNPFARATHEQAYKNWADGWLDAARESVI